MLGMNTVLLKKIDRYGGRLLARILAPFSEKKELPLPPKTILVIRLWAIGESLLATPSIVQLRKTYPDARITVLTTPATAEVLADYWFVNRVVSLPLRFSSFASFVFFRWRSYDLVIDFEPFLYCSALLAFALGKARVGFDTLSRGRLYTKAIQYNDNQHTVQTFADLAVAAGAPAWSPRLVPVRIRPKHRLVVKMWLRSCGLDQDSTIVAIAPSVSGKTQWRRWPEARFAEIADRISQSFPCHIVLVGGRDDQSVLEEVQRHMKHKALIASHFSLKEMAYLLECCRLVVSNDSGLMHVAAAMKTQTLGLFGPETPKRFGPYGSAHTSIYHQKERSPVINVHRGEVPGMLKGDEDLMKYMEDISVEEVWRSVRKMLGVPETIRGRLVQPKHSILVAGQPKTGTTALYFWLKESMPGDTVCLNEQLQLNQSLVSGAPRSLAKILLFPGWFDFEAYDQFREKILLVRDPRDTLISSLLYWVSLSPIKGDPHLLDQFVEALRAKEQSPADVPFTSLIELWDRLDGRRFLDIFQFPLSFHMAWHKSHQDVLVFPYEDMVDGKAGALEDFLGFPLVDKKTTIDVRDSYVARTRSYGNWKHWFTSEDINLLSSLLGPYMDMYGYEDNWEPSSSPSILPEHSSGYVKRLVGEVQRVTSLT